MLFRSGQFQQSLPSNRYQLLRVRLDSELGFVPEISGNRMLVSVRFNRPDEQGRWVPCTEDLNFEMALCA